MPLAPNRPHFRRCCRSLCGCGAGSISTAAPEEGGASSDRRRPRTSLSAPPRVVSHRRHPRCELKPADPVPRRRVQHTDARRGRPHPRPASGHRLDHLANRLDPIKAADQNEARDQRVRHRARPAPAPTDPKPVTQPANPNRTRVARPEPHRLGTRPAQRSRHHNRLAGSRVHIDGIRPYGGDGAR